MQKFSLSRLVDRFGVEVDSISDCIHEVCHGLSLGIPTPWTRDDIANALKHLDLQTLLEVEAHAVAVSHCLCKRLGVTPTFAGMTLTYTEEVNDLGLTLGYPVGDEEFFGFFSRHLESPKTLERVAEILVLAGSGTSGGS